MNEMSVEKWWNEILVRENGGSPEKTCSDPVSSTTKPTWSDRDGGRLATNRLRHRAAYVNIENVIHSYTFESVWHVGLFNTYKTIVLSWGER